MHQEADAATEKEAGASFFFAGRQGVRPPRIVRNSDARKMLVACSLSRRDAPYDRNAVKWGNLNELKSGLDFSATVEMT